MLHRNGNIELCDPTARQQAFRHSCRLPKSKPFPQPPILFRQAAQLRIKEVLQRSYQTTDRKERVLKPIALAANHIQLQSQMRQDRAGEDEGPGDAVEASGHGVAGAANW
jgi:hypothetical protein